MQVNLTAIKQYQYYIVSWSIKVWAPIFVRPKAVTDLKNGLYSPLVIVYYIILFWCGLENYGPADKKLLEVNKKTLNKSTLVYKSYYMVPLKEVFARKVPCWSF